VQNDLVLRNLRGGKEGSGRVCNYSDVFFLFFLFFFFFFYRM